MLKYNSAAVDKFQGLKSKVMLSQLDSGACPVSWLPPAHSLRWRLFVRTTECRIVSLAADLMSVAAKCQQRPEAPGA